MKKFVFNILFFLSLFMISDAVKANYWLVIGTYRQGPGGRAEVSGITSPSLHTIPMKDIETCERAGEKISKEINYSFVRQWIVVLSEKKYSKISINRKIASLKSYFDFLVNIDIIDSSPLKGHKNLKSSSKIVIPFSEKEIDQVFENFESSDMNNRDKLMIEIFYSTGIRRDELINIKLVDILFESRVIKVTGKRNKQRMIPMLPNLSSNITDYINNSDPKIYLFESKKSKKLWDQKKRN